MAKNDDSLFLLEVLIDKIVFVKSPCFSDKDFKTCVNIECPAVQPLEICDDDPGVCIARSGGPFVKTFNNGKSCLFSLKEVEISAAMNKFPIKVSVYKSLPCGCLPTKIVMGEATIDMTKEFVQTRNKFLEDPSNVSYQALKDSFRIVGPDGTETGEIVMFLRISCFGKLIITRFQGAGGTPNIGASGSNAVVDRSCAQKRDFQTAQDPCACGAARTVSGKTGSAGPNRQTCVSGGGGVCQSARDPYNSMPCDDSDDPCFCSGPMAPTKPNNDMVCRNTDQYCLHIPKGPPPSAPIWQETKTERWTEIKARDAEKPLQCLYNNILSEFVRSYSEQYPKIKDMFAECVHCNNNEIDLPDKLQHSSNTSITSNYSKYGTSIANTIRISRSQNSICTLVDDFKTGIFGRNEIEVYMTLFSDLYHCRASGTQATAFINKCLQVNCDLGSRYDASILGTDSDYASTCTMSTLPSGHSRRRVVESTRYHDIYFFGRKKDAPKSTGMGSTGSNTKLHRTKQSSSTATRSEKSGSCMKGSCCQPTVSVCSSCSAQTKNTRGASTATNTVKAVSIKEDKPKKPCPALGATKGDMAATVSHIRIGPKEPCPVHGKDPCQGPKCIVASSGEEQAAVKVTTVTNPRRGVFELVIRRMTGAPLAKNELMLEWTPPPSRPPPCAGPCPIPCAVPTTCRPSKCKIIICKPSPCKPKCCKKPCGLSPCKSRCQKCCKILCCGKKCNACGPPCSVPCGGNPCNVPCKSSPCLRPCPVGRKRPRKTRSQPKIKMNRKRTSPCLNRAKTCPVVRCRSMPSPCFGCCGLPPCPPRKCCSVAPCKPPRCSKSSCSVCCI